MISSADALATKAGVRILEQNGNAVDAAIATSAAMAVVAPHLCGMGGDLFALVHVDGQVHSLNAAGRAGSGVNPEQLRQQGFTHVPMNANFNSVTVPGCVAGWLALHERFGTLPLELLFSDAIGLAENGFRSSPLLINSFKRLDDSLKQNFKDLYSATTEVAPTIKRPGVGRTLRAVATHGRDAFYAGEFAEGLIEMASGMYTREDLASASATWDKPISIDVYGHRVWSTAAPSQGYLFLAALAISEQLELPDDPNDAQWAHLLIEASTAVGYDRTEVLHDRANLGGVFISEKRLGQDKKDRGISVLVADSGRQEIRPDGSRYLILENGYRYDGSPGMADYRAIKYDTYGVLLARPDVSDEVTDRDAIPTTELLGSKELRSIAELQWRISLPLLVFIVTLMAVPLSRVNPRQGRFLKLLPAILLYMAYLTILIAARGALEKGKLPASLGLWWVHGIFLVIGLGLLYWEPLQLKRASRRALEVARG